jgi:hypothetical protein
LHELIAAAEVFLRGSNRTSGGSIASQEHDEKETRYGHAEIVSGSVALAQRKTRP